MVALLSVGTSSKHISLVSTVTGYMIDDWTVGGDDTAEIFHESQLADYRQLAAYRDVTVFETFNLKLRAANPDDAADHLAELKGIVRQAKNFWVQDWNTEGVVYLAVRASCETNKRYAVVHDMRLVGEANPFGQPFLQANGTVVMDELALIVERGPWLENEPGTGTAVAIGVTQTYDGRTVGNVDDTGTATPTTDAQTVFVANKHNVAQLTDIWWWDNSANQWTPGGNLMDTAPPFAFLPPTPLEVGDFVIFGTASAVANSGPFSSLVFDIGTALGVGGGITIDWFFSNIVGPDPGVDWSGFTAIHDNTNAAGAMTGDSFDTTGINSIHWEQPAGWAVQNPDPTGAHALGINGLWVCAYVTAVPGAAPTPPIQQKRAIYTVTWPYVEFAADQVGGDLPALLRLTVDTRSAKDGLGASTDLWCQRVVAGLRSYERGENFTAYINLSDEQNNADVTVALGGGTAFGNDATAPTGRQAVYTAAGVDAIDVRAYVTLTPDWYGRYHAYVRGKQVTGVAGCVSVRLEYSPGDTTIYADKKTVTRRIVNMLDDQLLDFGQVTLGLAAGVGPLEMNHVVINIEAGCDSAGGAMFYFYDLILIPVDEWAIDSEDMFKTTGAYYRTNDYLAHLDIDGIRNARGTMSNLIINGTDKITRNWRVITNGLPILQTGKQQRLWFLATHGDPADSKTNFPADSELCHTLQIWRNQRYTGMRGRR